MPKVNFHRVNDADHSLEIIAAGEPGAGGAHALYQVTTPLTGDLPAQPRKRIIALIQFQEGNPHEDGINGLTNEVLLAILIDRLNGFQEGPFACNENQNALRNCTLALETLHARTRERIHRGVEGVLLP